MKNKVMKKCLQKKVPILIMYSPAIGLKLRIMAIVPIRKPNIPITSGNARKSEPKRTKKVITPNIQYESFILKQEYKKFIIFSLHLLSMFHIRHHAHGTLHYLKNKELDELYVSFALKTLAIALINIFVPIYLFNLGFDISKIAFYYLILYLSISLFMPFGTYINSKIGVKKGMVLGTSFLILHFIFLNKVPEGMPYYIPAILYGINAAFYWAAFHFEFTKFSDDHKEASEISIINIVALAASAIAPLLGSLFITEISYSFLFFVVVGLLVLSLIPLFFTKDVKGEKPDFSLSKIMRSDSNSKAFSYMALGIIATSLLIFWPLYIYLQLGTVLSLGSIVTITGIIILAYTFFVGKWADRKENKILKLGMWTHAFSWITRIFFLSPVGIFFNNLYSSTTAVLLDISFNKLTYEQAKKTKKLANYFIFREIFLSIGTVAILVLAIIFQNIPLLFVVTFASTFLFTKVLKKI